MEKITKQIAATANNTRTDAFQIAEAIAHKSNGGTFSITRQRFLTNEPLFLVSLYPDRTLYFRRPPSAAQIDVFIVVNTDLLERPENHLGWWIDAATGITHLDVSWATPDRVKAKLAGRLYNQIGVWDLAAAALIPTDGTGEPVPHLIHALDRALQFEPCSVR